MYLKASGMAKVEVLKAGALSTIQDMGRDGFREFGVPVSGVMDKASAKLANALVKNGEDNAVLEITLTGPELKMHGTGLLALCGADISPMLNGKSLKMNTPFLTQNGDVLSFGKLRTGCRAYLAVAGGFQTETVMKSRSWLKAITAMSVLKKGTMLPIQEFDETFEEHHASVAGSDFGREELEAWRGPEFKTLPEKARETLASNKFTVSKDIGRMGVQLDKQPDLVCKLPEMLTSPVIPGTVQLTPAGNLIVLMRDCQTTGGYPRALQLTEAALNLLAQKRPGQKVNFGLK